MKRRHIYFCLVLIVFIISNLTCINDTKDSVKADVFNDCIFCRLDRIEIDAVGYIICTNDSTILDINLKNDFKAKNNGGSIEALRVVKKHSCDNGTIIVKKKYGKKNINLNINYSSQMYDNIVACSECKRNICWDKGYVYFYCGQIYNLLNEEQIKHSDYYLNIDSYEDKTEMLKF